MFYDENKGGGLWVGKRYGGGGDTNREPLKHLSHAASVNQVCRYYYLLANGKLVNYERSKQMLDIMGNPDLHHKFVAVLEKIAPQADTGRRYILVALIDDPRGGQIIKDLVYPVEKVLKITKSKPKS